MTDIEQEAYREIADETFIINDTKLSVAPTDVTLFSDNAVYGTSFTRSNAVFAYRSKHAREKVILTVPISVSINSLTNDNGISYGRAEGMKVLTQLSNYPFCFIKSARIESYVAPAGNISTAGFMMFGVEQITAIHDMSVPDVLFVEYHLVFANHNPLVKDYKFKRNDGSTTEYPSASDLFVDVFSRLGPNSEDVERFLADLSLLLGKSEESSGAYYSTDVPYGSAIMLAPHMYNAEDNSLSDNPVSFSNLNPADVKTIEISGSKGSTTSSMQMLTSVESTEKEFQENNSANKEIVQIGWSAFTDMSLLGQSALQSIKITKYNKIARHFVSAHKHPVLQYMGAAPSRVEMSFISNTSDSYANSEDMTSIVESYTQMFNILDYNAMMFPAANAYNYLKLNSLVSMAMGVNKLIPNQKYISASSSRQGVETLNMTFIETNVEEFLALGNVEQGREGAASHSKTRDKVIEAFLPNFNPGVSNLPFTDGLRSNFEVMEGVAAALRSMASEFSKGYSQAKFSDQDNFDNLVSDIKSMVPSTNTTSAWLLGAGIVEQGAKLETAAFSSLRNIFTGGHSSGLKEMTTAFLERSKYRQIYIQEGASSATSKLSDIHLELLVKTGRTGLGWEKKTVSAGTSDNFVQNGAVDMHLNKVLVGIQHLAALGDTNAKSALSLVNSSIDSLNDASVISYTGVNYPDIKLSGVKDSQTMNPMDFLVTTQTFKLADLQAAEKIVSETFTETVDDKLMNSEVLDNLAAKNNETLRAPVLHKTDSIDEQAYIKENTGGFFTNILGGIVDALTASGGIQASQTGFMNASGAPAGKNPDWIAYKGNATQESAKAAIVNAVNNSSLIPANAKQDWIYFLTTVAGVESQLGLLLDSGTGAKGLMQITGQTARGYGLNYNAVATNHKAAAEGAIKIFADLQKKAKSKGYNRWEDLFVYYNLGEGAGPAALSAFYGKSGLNTSAKKGILTQGIAGLSSSTPDKTLVNTYMGTINSKFGHLSKYVNKSSQTTVSDQGLKKEVATPVTVSRQDIKDNYVKATLLPNGYNIGSWFDASVNGKTVRVNIEGIATPYPPTDKEISINGKTVKYTEKGQQYGKEAKAYISDLLKGGFYIQKSNASSVVTPVLTMNFEDVGKKVIDKGLAVTVTGSPYKNANINFAGQKDKKMPYAFADQMKSYRAAVSEGAKPLLDIVEKGTTPVYADGSSYSNKDVPKEGSQVTYKPSSVTNNYIPFTNGTGQVTSEYGKYRTKAKNGVSREGYHFGLDATPSGGAGTNIVAPAKGIVVQAGYAGAAGQRVRIWHDKIGFSTQFFHLSKMYVKEGQRVNTNQIIGIMGGTGGNYSPHLHYQVGFGNAATGNLVDPWKTTKLSEIPEFKGGKGSLKEHAKSFLHPAHYTNYVNKDLRSTGKVYSGGSVSMAAGAQGYFSESGPAGQGADAAAGSSGGVAIKPTLSEPASRGISNSHSVYNNDRIVQAQLKSMIYPYEQGLNTMFPVLRAYITVGSDTEDLFLRESIRLGYYFELNGIANLQLVCNNDHNPVDLIRMSVANPSFAMTDDYSVTGKYLTSKMESIYGPNEMQWVADRIKLKPGAKLHIRAGYGNDPNKLETIFNGTIQGMSHSKGLTLDLLCEGFGRELLTTQIDPVKHKPAGGEWHNSSTGVVMSKALLQDGITHFGTSATTLAMASSLLKLGSNETDSDDVTDPESKRLVTRSGLSIFSGSDGFGFHYTKGNLKQRLFTNIYAAEIDKLHPEFSSNLWNYLSGLLSLTEKAGYYYIFEGQTPWEACKEMEYRHPGTKVKPLFYDDRMTMFFGLKEQMYIARDLNPQYMASVARNKGDVDQISSEYLSQRPKRMELVTKMHIASSEVNIISNGLSLNSDFNTGVNVVFFEDNEERESNDQEDFGEFKMKVDDNLNFWEYRYKTISMPGTHGKYSSFMYGTTALRMEAEEMYGGKILLVGNPHIKAGDYIFINDELNKMQGIVKVRECMHHYGESGYTTEITPGLYIESSNFFYSTLLLRLGMTAQIASEFASIGVMDSSFSSSNFNSYYEVFQAYKTLTSSTNIDKLNNGIAYNTFYGASVAAGAGLAALLGYVVVRTANMLGLTSARLAKLGKYGMKGISAVRTGGSFIGSVLQSTFLSKTAQATSTLKNTSVLGKFASWASKGIKSGSKAVLGLKAVRAFRSAGTAVLGILAANPISLAIAAIGTLAFAYVDGLVQESTLARQPLMFFPINYVGRPYTAGISGYKYNSWYESKMENLDKNILNTRKGLSEIAMTKPNGLMSVLLGLTNGDAAQKAADSIITIDEEQTLRK